jgi:hypothetical protein
MGGCSPAGAPAIMAGAGVAAHGVSVITIAGQSLAGSMSLSMGTTGSTAGNMKVLSKKQLEKLGIDAEAFKSEIVDKQGGSFNIATDKDGNVFLVPVRTGTRDPVPTGLTLQEIIPPQ